MERSKKIIDWIASHPLFSINGMCLMVGVDTSNFMRRFNAGKLPEKYIDKIENVIKEYGYEKSDIHLDKSKY